MVHFHLPEHSQSYWRDTSKLKEFPSLDTSIHTEVGVVGGGITGITTAYLLTKQNVKVTLIDANPILKGTTGHTTAKITAQHGLIYDELIQHFGLEQATLYYKAMDGAKQFIENTIKELQIKCDYYHDDAFIYTNSDQWKNDLEKEKAAYDQLGIKSELLEAMPLQLPMKLALQMQNQAHFHPLKYLTALLEKSLKNGLTVYENTVAVDIDHNHTSPVIVTKEGHRITCNHIISASHFPFYDRDSFYFTRMYAERAYVLGMQATQKYPGGMYINAESPTRSVRSTKWDGKELWLISGENHKTGQGKPTHEHFKSLQAFAEENFTVASYDYRWSAQDLTTLDKVPYIGYLKKSTPNILVATGFRKWGMTNGTAAANILTDLIMQVTNEYAELFEPSRFKADPSIKKFVQTNTDVAKQMIQGKLDNTNNQFDLEQLKTDQATVTRINGKRSGVYKDIENQIHIVDTTCTHLKCEVEWNSGERTWDCPCHGSRFSYTGEVINGPANKPLKKMAPDKLN
ncbi:FAD-dependent oxidoreductase [Virgibacillus pantothenticus]|uniref:(2Fe-2S)-binding protein n=1 Tax=Virgibacillus pantothenticus TaxID=1473 RepID=A0A0L0QP01_VIRPA|nr:FAD-dependent oxidoreductase [Virgibacillus pantothenticus]KNE20312.1 (2Fe-2S)-binding protein [Virgibacillus pantothenticus]MED3738403.1 FAD-dependent oxidoreductase [Virgibacillus pantothenticus]QTY17937.1 FAD-dependent oxidoreductase [Virgibacillus pantothenticus]SIS54589.1 Glycine/D-amino acid oxidase [Virgibacillus pantothenticus]